MRANASWDNADRTVVRFDMLHGWSWRDLARAVQRAARLERDCGRRIDLLFDLRDIPPPPGDRLFSLNELGSGRAFARLVACTPRAIAVVGATHLIRAMFAHNYVAGTVEPPGLVFVDTLEQARAYVAAAQRRAIIYDVVASA